MNKSILSGRICTFPKIHILQSADDVINLCTFVISVEKELGDNRENVDPYEFFECFCMGDAAKQIVSTYTKHSKVIISGKLKNFRFEDTMNAKHFTNIVAVEYIEYGDTKSFIDNSGSKKSSVEKVVTAEYDKIDTMFAKACSNGFSMIDEADYYRLAMNLL